MSDKQLIIFTMKGCPWCQELKEILVAENIEFIDRDINEYEKEYKLFVEITNNDYVPSFMIINDINDLSKTKLYAPDRDFEGIEEGVSIIKENFKK